MGFFVMGVVGVFDCVFEIVFLGMKLAYGY